MNKDKFVWKAGDVTVIKPGDKFPVVVVTNVGSGRRTVADVLSATMYMIKVVFTGTNMAMVLRRRLRNQAYETDMNNTTYRVEAGEVEPLIGKM